MTVDWMYWIVGVLTATMLSFGPWVTPSGHDPEIKWKWCARNILFELSFLICKMEIIIVPPLVLPLWLEIIYCTWDFPGGAAAAAAAKSLQSCPTLCDAIDDSPPGSSVPGILQARTLEWVAISFSNAWKWKVKVKSLSRVQLLATPRTTAYQAPPPMGFSRQEYWSGVPSPSPNVKLVYSNPLSLHRWRRLH